MSNKKNTETLYKEIIKNVIKKIKEESIFEGCSEDIIFNLKSLK